MSTIVLPDRMTGSGHGAAATESRADTRRQRDASVDITRAWCLTVVVALHTLMVGVSVTADGPVLANAMESWPWFALVSWFVQIMPLFVVLGGFSSYTQWTRMRSQGVDRGTYVAQRMQRLLRPAASAVAAVVVTLAGLTAVGVPADLVATAGFRLSQPLWFLGVYILCSALVPLMAGAHRSAPVLTVATLAAAVIAVDVVRLTTAVTAVGFANLLFVWLLIQQLGFWLADGDLRCFVGVGRFRGRRLGVLAVLSLVSLLVLASAGVYSFDMLANLNPPTFALVLLGVAQLALFELARPALRRLQRIRALAAVVDAVNARAMTIYLWHMLVLIGLAGMLLISGLRLPVPLSAEWWLSRPLWLTAVVGAVTAVVAVAGRVELQRTREGDRPSAAAGERRRLHPGSPYVSSALGAGGVLVVLITGFSLPGGVLGAGLLAAALRALGERRPISSSGVR
jgi:hypothetical protein